MITLLFRSIGDVNEKGNFSVAIFDILCIWIFCRTGQGSGGESCEKFPTDFAQNRENNPSLVLSTFDLCNRKYPHPIHMHFGRKPLPLQQETDPLLLIYFSGWIQQLRPIFFSRRPDRPSFRPIRSEHRPMRSGGCVRHSRSKRCGVPVPRSPKSSPPRAGS